MTAICYPDSQLQSYINSDLLLSKAEDWAAVDLNAFSLIWFVLARSWAVTFSSNDSGISWQLADKSTFHLYNLKCLFWFWEDQAFCLGVLYLNIHPIHIQLSLHIDSYLPLYHHHYLCVNVVVLLVTHKTTRSWGIEISTYLAITSSSWHLHWFYVEWSDLTIFNHPDSFQPFISPAYLIIIIIILHLRCMQSKTMTPTWQARIC